MWCGMEYNNLILKVNKSRKASPDRAADDASCLQLLLSYFWFRYVSFEFSVLFCSMFSSSSGLILFFFLVFFQFSDFYLLLSAAL